MTPYYDDGQARFYHGDVCDVLAQLPDGCVQTCVTSPPYWGLRDYGTAQWEPVVDDSDHYHIGPDCLCLDEFYGCDHLKPILDSSVRSSTLGASTGGRSEATHRRSIEASREPFRDVCGKCGARRIDAQLGLEATPDEYVARMVAVFRAVRRVLADDGTVWLNLGDSYFSNQSDQVADSFRGVGSKHDFLGGTAVRPPMPPGARPKNLVGIPWRVAFALQADGWYLRSDIIWAKPNPMPESVTDRPTKAHEYVFLLTKRGRYYYDADAVREPAEWARWGAQSIGKEYRGINPIDMDSLEERRTKGRNTRTVWTIATEPYPDAHFAVFPSELPRRCILAGSREGDTVLDPFLGSGTTAMVAKSLGRKAIGIDLSADYLDLAVKRCRQLGLFTEAS